MRYKRKPVFVAAIQWTGNNLEEIQAIYPGEVKRIKTRGGIELSRETEYGSTKDTAYKGDYICCSPSGEYSVYGREAFEMLFEPAENDGEETEEVMRQDVLGRLAIIWDQMNDMSRDIKGLFDKIEETKTGRTYH